jgi:mannose-6-phosphate isomerase-like protein (cupin superfamily)
MTTSPSSYLDGDAAADFWFLNSIVSLVADASITERAFVLYRQVAPCGFATPYHTHAAYGEGFYVLDGEVTFFCDGTKTVLEAGGFIFLPGSKPHGFRVTGTGPATMMIVSPPESTFGDFVREMGEPAMSRDLPIPSTINFARLAALSAKHGSIVHGPLPT